MVTQSLLLISTRSNGMEFTIISDASGAWECGGWCGSAWFHMAWDGKTRDMNLTAKKLIPIIVAAVIRGQNWKGGKILAHCDNAAVVAVLNS